MEWLNEEAAESMLWGLFTFVKSGRVFVYKVQNKSHSLNSCSIMKVTLQNLSLFVIELYLLICDVCVDIHPIKMTHELLKFLALNFR
jgi:hypothetical protein